MRGINKDMIIIALRPYKQQKIQNKIFSPFVKIVSLSF
jgi:hypothetical protein